MNLQRKLFSCCDFTPRGDFPCLGNWSHQLLGSSVRGIWGKLCRPPEGWFPCCTLLLRARHVSLTMEMEEPVCVI